MMLTPVAVLAAAMGAWRLGADPGWTADFVITNGLLSRYQFWFAVAIGVAASAFLLNRWVLTRKIATPALAPRERILR
jgi:hypothetical protein